MEKDSKYKIGILYLYFFSYLFILYIIIIIYIFHRVIVVYINDIYLIVNS